MCREISTCMPLCLLCHIMSQWHLTFELSKSLYRRCVAFVGYRYLYERLSKVPRVSIYGPPPSRGRAALCAFNVEGLHATDVSTMLDLSGVAVRSGHHCTQPLHRLDLCSVSVACAVLANT
jgi:hypothetical protein